MAEMKAGSGVISCDERCGCPSPCPGGVACRCKSDGGGVVDEEHKKCSCGEHCGCNPCSCSNSSKVEGTGKAFCKCAQGCSCVTCAS